MLESAELTFTEPANVAAVWVLRSNANSSLDAVVIISVSALASGQTVCRSVWLLMFDHHCTGLLFYQPSVVKPIHVIIPGNDLAATLRYMPPIAGNSIEHDPVWACDKLRNYAVILRS